jgi:hypothetical protein
MQKNTQTVELSEGLDELLETHVQNLSEKLSRPYAIEEIEEDLSALNDLVYTYKRRDELLEKLLDGTTAAEKRKQILEALQAQHIRVADNQVELERVHARSHELLQKSTLLVVKAQSQISRLAHKHTGYALEFCGLCKGLGGSREEPCVACNGKGSVLVHEPAIKCPRCGGDGKPTTKRSLIYSSDVCVVCRGTGWVLTKDQ